MKEQLDESDLERLEQIEFPPNAPKGQCVGAVLEVRKYIHDHNEATRDQIWSEIILDTSRDSAGRDVCKNKGYVPKFRKWWWNYIITPGLQIIPDVEPVDEEGLNWRLVKDGT